VALEPGFIPKGWKRGDRVRLINGDFKYGPEMAIEHAEIRSFDAPFDMEMIAGIRAHVSESARVKAWLNWWNADGA
jgi:hypothetical protein